MNNFRSTGKSSHYQPPMKKRGVDSVENIQDEKTVSESTQSAQQNSQPNCPPPKPPHRPNQRPSNRPTPPPKKSSAPDSEQLDRLVNTASKHLNTSPDELKNAAQSGNMQKLFSQMSPSQAQQLQKILSDENAAKKLLSTPQAQALLRGLSKNE